MHPDSWKLLEDIRDAATFVLAAVSRESFPSYEANRLLRQAVERNFEIIGEAARRVDGDYHSAHREIPWQGLTSLRNVLIHQYEGVDLEQVWSIIESELPALRSSIAAILPPLDQLERELAGED